MTLGNAAAARIWLILWCRYCGHQVEPDPAEMAVRRGPNTSMLDRRQRLVCSRCGSRRGRYGGASEMRRSPLLPPRPAHSSDHEWGKASPGVVQG